MTANHEHTPTTEQVRDGFRYDELAEWYDPVTPHHVINGRAFDRWYQAEIAAAEQRGAIKALRDASKSWFTLADQMDHAPGKYYAGFWLKECADRIANKEGDDG